MKRLISICLLLVVLLASAISVNAASSKVVYTSESTFTVGGTATVDLKQTARNAMDDPSVTSDIYNAALEGFMDVMWRCSNGSDKYGTSVTWTADDVGKEYVCRVSFYADSARTEYIDYISGEPFIVSATAKPTILTEDQFLPEATADQEYYYKLECSDPNAVFEVYIHPEYANQLDSSGLSLTSSGELKGTPRYYGRYAFSVRAYNAAGEDIRTFIVDVVEGAVTVVEVLQAPNKVSYYVGETLDLTGLKVRVTKPDGTSFESNNGEKLTISTSPLVTLGEQKIKVAYGDAFDIFIVTVREKPTENPAITTKTLPEATVGQSYYVKLDCTDPDASFGEWHNPGAANDLSKTGLILTQHGELEGTPSEAGTYTFTIYAAGEGGEGYMTYTLVVKEAEGTDPTEPSESVGGTEGTEPTDPTENATQEGGNETNEDKDGRSVWLIVAIVLGVLIVGTVVAIVVLLLKKKPR